MHGTARLAVLACVRDLLLALHETPRDVIAGGTPCVPHD